MMVKKRVFVKFDYDNKGKLLDSNRAPVIPFERKYR